MLGKNAMITKVVRDIETGRILGRRLRWTEQHFARAMGVRFPSVTTGSFVGPLPANATETVVLVTPPITEPIDGCTVLLCGCANLTLGTSTTAINVKIRLGSTTAGLDQSAGGWTVTGVAGNQVCIPCFTGDVSGAPRMSSYCMTVTQTGATVAGVWQFGNLWAFVL